MLTLGRRLFYLKTATKHYRLASTLTTMSDWRRVTPSNPEIPPFSVFTKPIVKSQQDDREYRIIRLDNGLEATLVHDATADKAAASLDVTVGHLSDPVSGSYNAMPNGP